MNRLGVATLLGLAAGASVAAWGFLIEPRLLETRAIRARVPGLPADWHGKQLALLGDLQVGAPLANTDTVRRAIARVVERKPAAVLLAGDYVYNAGSDPASVIGDAVELLRPLGRAGIPSLGVLGNHDFAGESTHDPSEQRALANTVEEAFEGIGIRVLRNAAVALAPPGGGGDGQALWVVGLGERSAHEDDWRAAFDAVPRDAPRVVLAHNPSALRPIPPGWAPLALAGHTHGGQIRVPGMPELAPARVWVGWPNYLDGWIGGLLRPGNHVYVNRGIGFSRLPIRIGALPEVTFITLHGGT